MQLGFPRKDAGVAGALGHPGCYSAPARRGWRAAWTQDRPGGRANQSYAPFSGQLQDGLCHKSWGPQAPVVSSPPLQGCSGGVGGLWWAHQPRATGAVWPLDSSEP